MSVFRAALFLLMTLFPMTLSAQGMTVAFGDLQQDSDAPVEVTADNLVVSQEDGSATFTGDVHVAQGTMRMSAPKVAVFYNEETQAVSKLVASGGVLIVNGDDAAEATDASYDVEGQWIEMTGGVLLTQKLNTISADRMVVDIQSSTAEMHGRVKTVLKSGEN